MDHLETDIFGLSEDEDLDDLKMPDFEDEDEEEFKTELPTFQKVQGPPKEKKSIQKKPKKVSAKRESPPPPTNLSPEAAKRLEAHHDVDIALAKIKNKGRKRGDLMDETEMDEKMIALLDGMREAAYSDQENIKEKKPAYSKMKLLVLVQDQLAKKHLHAQFLENNILDGIRLWLEPLPDATLPNIKLQKALMKILEEMPIETHHLRQSLIGRIVMFYTKSPRIMPDIKEVALGLIDKWMRPILKRSADYKDEYQNNPIEFPRQSGSSSQRGSSQRMNEKFRKISSRMRSIRS